MRAGATARPVAAKAVGEAHSPTAWHLPRPRIVGRDVRAWRVRQREVLPEQLLRNVSHGNSLAVGRKLLRDQGGAHLEDANRRLTVDAPPTRLRLRVRDHDRAETKESGSELGFFAG